jgi:hypothetical protein
MWKIFQGDRTLTGMTEIHARDLSVLLKLLSSKLMMILSLFVTAAVAWLAFVLYESRQRDPLMDLRFFHSVPFSSAAVLSLKAYSCFAGFLFLNVPYRERVRGFSAFCTGLFMLPTAVMIIACALVRSAGRKPWKAAFSAGFGRGIFGGQLMLSTLGQQTPVGWLLAAHLAQATRSTGTLLRRVGLRPTENPPIARHPALHGISLRALPLLLYRFHREKIGH